MKIGLLYPSPDPLAPAIWSGSPSGLAAGLRELGIEVVPLGTRLPLGVHEAVAVLSRISGKRGAVAERTWVRQYSRTVTLGRQLAEHGSSLDGLIAMGLEMFDLARIRPPGLPVASFDDATLIQMWRVPESDIRSSNFSERHVAQWFERQRQSAQAATVCCVSTGYAAKSFMDDYGIDANRIVVVGMGHRPRSRRTNADRDWSKPRFLFVGIDWHRKNGHRVLDAFAKVREILPGATLDVVGDHNPIQQAGVRDHGFLARDNRAAQAALDSLYENSTVFVLPSRYDLSPVAYLEAASAGLPVIGSTEGGASEVLGKAAISVHPDDNAGLAAAMMTLADGNTARASGLRAAEAAASFSWARVAGKIISALGLTPSSSFEGQSA
jgi:glycosyltransferase involved in cell wall biosynthesis